MAKEIFSNNATTTLGSNVSSTTATITLATGTGNEFPVLAAGQYFSGTMFSAGSDTGVPNEIVYVTARTGDTLTVARGQEGTTPQAWAVGDTFANYFTAGAANNLIQVGDLQSQTTNSADDTGTANAGAIALVPAITNLAQILLAPIRVLKMNAVNTGAYTLNINGLGAEPVTLNGVALAAGQLLANTVFEVTWDGTNLELISTPAVTVNKGLALMGALTVKANSTGAPAAPQDVGLTAFLNFLGFETESFTSPSGSITLPFGLILKYGTGQTFSPSAEVNFPVAFPNACLNVIPSDSGTSPTSWSAPPSGYSKTGFAVHCQAGGGGEYVYWALGF